MKEWMKQLEWNLRGDIQLYWGYYRIVRWIIYSIIIIIINIFINKINIDIRLNEEYIQTLWIAQVTFVSLTIPLILFLLNNKKIIGFTLMDIVNINFKFVDIIFIIFFIVFVSTLFMYIVKIVFINTLLIIIFIFSILIIFNSFNNEETIIRMINKRLIKRCVEPVNDCDFILNKLSNYLQKENYIEITSTYNRILENIINSFFNYLSSCSHQSYLYDAHLYINNIMKLIKIIINNEDDFYLGIQFNNILENTIKYIDVYSSFMENLIREIINLFIYKDIDNEIILTLLNKITKSYNRLYENKDFKLLINIHYIFNDITRVAKKLDKHNYNYYEISDYFEINEKINNIENYNKLINKNIINMQ